MDELTEHLLQAMDSIALSTYERREQAIMEEQSILLAELHSSLRSHTMEDPICHTVNNMLQTLHEHAKELHLVTSPEMLQWKEEQDAARLARRRSVALSAASIGSLGISGTRKSTRPGARTSKKRSGTLKALNRAELDRHLAALRADETSVAAGCLEELASNLSCSPMTVKSFVEGEGIPLLLDLHRKADAANDTKLAINVLRCIQHITADENVAVNEDEDIAALLGPFAAERVGSSSSESEVICAWIFCNLAVGCSTAIKRFWFTNDGFVVTQSMLRSSSLGVQHRCASALSTIVAAVGTQGAKKTEFVYQTAQLEALLPIIWNLSEETSEDELRAAGLLSVANLMQQEKVRAWVRQEVGAGGLVAMLSSRHKGQARVGAHMVANMCLDPLGLEAMRDAGVVELVTDLIAAPVATVLVPHLWTLQNLVCNEECRKMISQHEGCIAALLRFLETKSALQAPTARLFLYMVHHEQDPPWEEKLVAAAVSQVSVQGAARARCFEILGETATSHAVDEVVLEKVVSALEALPPRTRQEQYPMLRAAYAALASILEELSPDLAIMWKERITDVLLARLDQKSLKPSATAALHVLASKDEETKMYIAEALAR